MKAFVSFKCVPLYIVKNQYKHLQVIDYPLSVSTVLWCFSWACCVTDFYKYFYTRHSFFSSDQSKRVTEWPAQSSSYFTRSQARRAEMAPRHTSLWHCFHCTTRRCSWWFKPAPQKDYITLQKQAYITLKFMPNTSQSHWTYHGRWSSWWEVLMPLHDCGKMLSVCPWKLSSSVCSSSVSASWVWEIRTGITAGHRVLYLQSVIVLYLQLVTVCYTWNWSSCVVLAIGHCVVLAISHCVVLAISHCVVLAIGHCVLYLKLVIVCSTCNWSLCCTWNWSLCVVLETGHCV